MNFGETDQTLIHSGVNAMPSELMEFQRHALQKTKNEMQHRRAQSRQIKKRPIALGLERLNFQKSSAGADQTADQMRNSHYDFGGFHLEHLQY